MSQFRSTHLARVPAHLAAYLQMSNRRVTHHEGSPRHIRLERPWTHFIDLREMNTPHSLISNDQRRDINIRHPGIPI
jgi:hypothetical protein